MPFRTRVQRSQRRLKVRRDLPIEATVELSEHPTHALLSIDALLEKAVALGASDLHLTSGSLPAVRLHGHIELLSDFPGARPRPRPSARLPDHDDRAAEAPRAEPAARLRLRHPRARPLPRQRLLPAREPRGRVPHHPHRHQVARGAEAAVLAARVHDEAARARARHRPDGLGQVDDARVPDRRDQPHPHRPHHHDRGSDRVPAQPQALHRQPARGRPGRDRLRRRRCAARCARTPT